VSLAPVSDVVQIYQSMSGLAREWGAVNLAQGIPEPLYDAQWRAAVAAELPEAHFQYTPTSGLPTLREAIGALYGADAREVVVTSGCTESLVAALSAHAGLGCREVLWLEPYYSYYPGIARAAGLAHRSLPLDLSGPGARLDVGALRRAVPPDAHRTALLLNSPHNPSGLTLTDDDWSRVLDLVDATGCHLVLDDTYRDFRYEGGAPPYARLLGSGRAVVAGTTSKSLAASGVRLGWLLAGEPVRSAAEGIHMHLSNCSPDLLQRAAVRVLGEVLPTLPATTDRYRRKRDRLLEALSAAEIPALHPGGGHFVMATLPLGGPDPLATAHELCREVGVVPLPMGSFFDRPGAAWLRFSFAVPPEDLGTACERLAWCAR
jgi:aspartate/methionine/tyrosine aminotransferase